MEYGLFFLAVFVCYHTLTPKPTVRVWFLAGVSLLFYATWELWFVPILLSTVVVDFYLAQRIAAQQAKARRAWLGLSVAINVGVLLGFKTLHKLGHISVIPLGLSFYTFQSMSYVIDVYRGMLPVTGFGRFFSAVTFFPHLMAGPIVRAQTLLPQFERLNEVSWPMARQGMWWIACGVCKKALADWVGGWVDDAYATPGGDWAASMIAALGFVAQIYGDFSGYSDIARGSALLLGFHLPANFYLPFSARSPLEYYSKRWHISLASWIADYLYTPLAMFFGRRWRGGVALGVLCTMLLMGLWHGLGWNYLWWGLYVGLLLIGSHWLWTRAAPRLQGSLGVALTFYLVTFGLVTFRAPDWASVQAVWLALHGGAESWGNLVALAWVVGLLGALHLLAILSDVWMPRHDGWWFFWLALMASLAFTLGRSGTNFIYFQF